MRTQTTADTGHDSSRPFVADIRRERPQRHRRSAVNHVRLGQPSRPYSPLLQHRQASGTDEPLPTVTTVDRHALAVPPFIVATTRLTGNRRPSAPVSTRRCRRRARSPATTRSSPGDAQSRGLRVPHVQPHEIQAAMAFRLTTKCWAPSRSGSSSWATWSTPPAMAILMQRVMETFS